MAEGLFVISMAMFITGFQYDFFGWRGESFFVCLAIGFIFMTLSFLKFVTDKNKALWVLFADFCLSLAVGNLITELFFDATKYSMVQSICAALGFVYVLYKIIKHRYGNISKAADVQL